MILRDISPIQSKDTKYVLDMVQIPADKGSFCIVYEFQDRVGFRNDGRDLGWIRECDGDKTVFLCIQGSLEIEDVLYVCDTCRSDFCSS